MLCKVDLWKYDMSGVTDMSNMFVGCSSLSELYISDFDMLSVTGDRNMFD